jgi:hypothetical protein
MIMQEGTTGRGDKSDIGRWEDAKVAGPVFDAAIQAGRLSKDDTAENYAGHYMFMGCDGSSGKTLFKHILTRQYID